MQGLFIRNYVEFLIIECCRANRPIHGERTFLKCIVHNCNLYCLRPVIHKRLNAKSSIILGTQSFCRSQLPTYAAEGSGASVRTAFDSMTVMGKSVHGGLEANLFTIDIRKLHNQCFLLRKVVSGDFRTVYLLVTSATLRSVNGESN